MSPDGDALLAVDGVAKRFGGFQALDGLSFALRPGEILGLVGPNGSGKTTCINVIAGLYPANGGEIRFDGRSIGPLPMHRRVHLGINRTFQIPKPFGSLTARQNVEVAIAHGRTRAAAHDAHTILASVGLEGQADRPAGELTSAQQKMLDLARALATNPRLLLVDELAAGLNAAELTEVAKRLRALAAAGIAMVVVEHLMGFIADLVQRVIVMNAGRVIFEGTLADAARDPRVVEVFLGADHGF